MISKEYFYLYYAISNDFQYLSWRTSEQVLQVYHVYDWHHQISERILQSMHKGTNAVTAPLESSIRYNKVIAKDIHFNDPVTFVEMDRVAVTYPQIVFLSFNQKN